MTKQSRTMKLPISSRRFTSVRLSVMLVLLISVWLGPVGPARAQAELALNALTIELWPEYDQPAMLVILRGTLAPQVALPATVTLHLPPASGGPSAVAAQDPNGELVNIPYTTTVGSDSIAVHLQTNLASFQVEYYDSSLNLAEADREYVFQWQADFPVSAVSVRVQEPVDTSDLSSEPPVTLAGTSGLGLNYYTAPLGALAAGQSLSLRLRYTKTSSTLSIETITTPSLPVPVTSDTPAQTSAPPPTWLIVGGLGLVSLVLIGLGVGMWIRDRRPLPRSRQRGATTARAPATEGAQYCTQCGQPAAAGDRFCRKCGQRLRGVS